MMDVYVIRHGESEGNVGQYYCGWGPIPLTEKGISDAEQAGKLLRSIPFCKVYSSDLKRAIQTCEIALPGVSYEQSPLLREINVGDLCGLTRYQAIAHYGEVHRQRMLDRDFVAYGGENTPMHNLRAAQFMQLLEQNAVEGNVAVFCHDGTIKGMLNYILHTQLPITHFVTDNGSVSVFRWDGNQWQLKHWNIIPHMNILK